VNRSPGSKGTPKGERDRIRVLHLCGALSLIAWIALSLQPSDLPRPSVLILWLVAQGLGWVALVTAVGSGPVRPPQSAVLAWAVAFRIVGLLSTPVLEDDPFRYLWDGRMFVLTGNPYRSPPSSSYGDADLPEVFQSVLDQVNHPELRTVYGPVSQLGFAVSHLVAPGRLWPWKLILFAAELTTWIAWRGRLGRRGTLLITWCPLAVAETAFNAHPEALGIALLSWGLASRSAAVSGACLALSGGAKALGWLLAPVFLARRGIVAWSAFAATLAAVYLPFLAQGHGTEFESLRIMATEWSFNASLVPLFGLILGDQAARLAGQAVFLVLVAGGSYRLARRFETGRRGAILWDRWTLQAYGALFLLSAAVNPWYLLWLLPAAAALRSTVAFVALAAVPLSYCTWENLGLPGSDPHGQPVWVPCLEYGSVAAAALLFRETFPRKTESPGSPKG
jgi:alpha-1,6-mannosyltransferase